MVTIGSYATQLIGLINSIAPNSRVRLAMIMGSGLESTWSPATGDQGTSFGPFQIHLPAHPGVSAAEAKDPAFAVRYMLGAYTTGVAKVPESLWQSDPKNAAALAAFYAERPKNMYAQSRIDSVWGKMQSSNYGSGDVGSVPPALGGSSPNGSGPQGLIPIPGVSGAVDQVKNLVITSVFALGGIALVALGMYRSVAPAMR